MNTTQSDSTGKPHARRAFTAALDREPGFNTFREAVADACDISVPTGYDNFRVEARHFNLGGMVLTEVRSASMSYRRSARHVARSGYDHYQIHLNLSSDTHSHSGRQAAIFHRGDIGIFDTMRTMDTDVPAHDGVPAHCVSIFIPRAMLAPLFATPGTEHGTVLRGNTRLGSLLREHVIAFLQRADHLTDNEANAMTQGMLGLMARGLGASENAAVSLRQALRAAMLAAAKRYIERHLGSAELCTDTICLRLGCSRATLYRLFEVDGGLINYIQRRRLQRAFAALISPRQPNRRILDIALDNHFASDATFTRAFSRTFGAPPGELRALANALQMLKLREPHSASHDDVIGTLRWMQRLSNAG